MSSQFPHESQPAYHKALGILATLDHMIGRPAPLSGPGAQVNQAGADLLVRIAEALNSASSTDRTRRLESAAQMAGALAALLDVYHLRGEGSEQQVKAIKAEVAQLADSLSTLAKSVAANKHLRQRVRL